MNHNSQAYYFAAANTTLGFMNYFTEIFDSDKVEKIFILKGGPGTGKSSLMRSVSSQIEAQGAKCELFLCASDPNSLDGILIEKKKIAILDGTEPHSYEATYPGLVENIINTGIFWDREKLLPYKKEIVRLVKEKKRFYKRAYRFLNAYGEIEEEIMKISEDALIENKLDQEISRRSEKLFRTKQDGAIETRLLSTFCLKGQIYLDSFINQSNRVFILEDFHHSAHIYLKRLFEKAREKNISTVRSFSCVFPSEIDGLMFPELKTCFVLGNRDYEKEAQEKEYHYVNMGRFLNKEQLSCHKQKLKFGKKCAEMLLSGAKDSFEQASELHKQLERIYVAAMDFSKLPELSKNIVSMLNS